MTQAAILAASGSPGTTTGFKNRIINGQMFIWQRGTSLTTASNQVYGFADRWLTNAGASTTWSQSTDVPAGFKYSVSVAGSTFNGINQRIESFNCSDLAGQSVTLSFWAKQSSGSSSLNVNLSYANSADNFSTTTGIVEAAISATPSSSWTRYSYTYVMPAGVVNGLQIILFCAAAANTTLFTGVQLEVGTTATNFDFRSIGTELALCQRYFSKSFDYDIAPVNGAAQAGANASVFAAYNANSGWTQSYSFKVSMRTTPTVTLYNSVNGSGGNWATYDGSSWTNATSAAFNSLNTNFFNLTLTRSGAFSGRSVYLCEGGWAANAEL